jgi:hypothetical protein
VHNAQHDAINQAEFLMDFWIRLGKGRETQ